VLSLLPLTVPEVRRLLLALDEPPAQFRFRLEWSHWRRHHQAVAKRAHVARRAQRVDVVPTAPVPVLPILPSLQPGPGPTLTEEQWQRVRPLLPPQQPPHGRPNQNHRQMVAAMLWRARTGCSWRALPGQFGPWATVASRFQRWNAIGLWPRILQAIDGVKDLAA
jgi:hypothetical protein